MNKLLICRLLGVISLLIGGSMAFSLPWAFPVFGQARQFELRSLVGLLGAMFVCLVVGGALVWFGRKSAGGRLYRREAIAVVGLSWLLATLLGAMPYWFSQTCRGRDSDGNPLQMNLVDGLFESASGFSGTGATVLGELENAELVPRAILFWRSETHFLGGLGIMVLFVAILGMGSAGKALLLTEMPGPGQETAYTRSQRAASVFAAIFVGLTLLLTASLLVQGVDLFDALCHAFGTIATGGFSTHDKSIEFFDSLGVEMTITLFMILACTNFTLLYYLVIRQPGKLLADLEFRVYLIILAAVTLLVVGFGLAYGDFDGIGQAVRYGLFQVTSIMTNTGFGTHDFDQWNSASRGLLFFLMFIGGCAGSTSCSLKVIRHILFFKILHLELERIFHPSVIRHVRIGGKVLSDPDLRNDVLVYFGMILVIFVVAWMTLVALEPDATWIAADKAPRDKLIDCASAVAATLNGVGPGLGIVGESENYAHFHPLPHGRRSCKRQQVVGATHDAILSAGTNRCSQITMLGCCHHERSERADRRYSTVSRSRRGTANPPGAVGAVRIAAGGARCGAQRSSDRTRRGVENRPCRRCR